MTRALITGITGQDGAYLASSLLEKGYEIFGAYRRGSTPNFWRLKALGITEAEITLVPFDLGDQSSIDSLFEKALPCDVYHLAAQSFVPVSFDQPSYVADVNGVGVIRILEAFRRYVKENADSKFRPRFYQASTSEMFGDADPPQWEETPFHPTSPYACAKVFAHHACVNYREAYGLHINCGICFNHESPLRGDEFVTKKIAQNMVRISVELDLGKEVTPLRLGNMASARDWGFAGDYVEAMWLMLQQDKPGDYVIATGESATVQDFVGACAEPLGIELEWAGEKDLTGIDVKTGQVLIVTDRAYFRPADHERLCAMPGRIRNRLGWQAKTNVRGLANLMVDYELAQH